jgi:glycosyltransferase involved in cell wall biosynthesis
MDNCSSDATSRIAERYAEKDFRIRLFRNEALLHVIANYNRAGALISPDARYLKYVAADDLLLPDCLRRMVDVAEANPTVRLVASYKIHGRNLVCDGPEFPREILGGREVCRRFFRGELGWLGGPTNHLIKLPAPLINGRIFDEDFLGADTEFFVRLLKDDAHYAFVHQVLTFTREHESTVSAGARAIGLGACEDLAILERHGHSFLPDRELKILIKAYRRIYARWLFRVLLKIWDRRSWKDQGGQRSRLQVAIGMVDMIEAAVLEAVASAASPLATLRSLMRKCARTVRSQSADPVQRLPHVLPQEQLPILARDLVGKDHVRVSAPNANGRLIEDVSRSG